MIDLYCRGQHHAVNGLCPGCTELREYTRGRLQRCPFQAGKTTCAKCSVHCYKPEMREETKAVMRYAGPRMLYRHPVMTLQHVIDGRRQKPIRSPRARATGTDPDGNAAECHQGHSLSPGQILPMDAPRKGLAECGTARLRSE